MFLWLSWSAHQAPPISIWSGIPTISFPALPNRAFIDPENLYILTDHLKCAAFELPFEEGENFGGDPTDLLSYLEEQGVLRLSSGRWFWSDRSYPSEGVSMRGGVERNVVIVDTTKGRNAVIGEMDDHSAREMLHDEAIYLHRGEQYQVKKTGSG